MKKFLIIVLTAWLLLTLCSCTEQTIPNVISGKVTGGPISTDIPKATDAPLPAVNPKGSFILYHCNIIDGTGAAPINNGAIYVKDGKIEQVGRAAELSLPDGVEKIDLQGRYVVPGLINAHTHYSYNEDTLQRWLRAGLTTVRDLVPIGVPDFIKRRDELNKNPKNARIVSASGMITVPGGYYGGTAITSPEEVAKAVTEYVREGVDLIKTSVEDDCQGRLWNKIPYEDLKSIVDTAHSLKKRVSAHITHTRNLQYAIDAGIDDIAHMVVEPIEPSTVQQLVKKNIYWVPTLELWNGVSKMYSIDYCDVAVENLSRFYKAGGKIALGTDYNGYYFEFDKDLPITEISLMQKAGMSNMDIIVAATKNAAVICDLGQVLGTLEKGKIADLVALEGNPLDRIQALQEPVMVLHNGIIAFQKGLE